MVDEDAAQGHCDGPGENPGQDGALRHFARVAHEGAAVDADEGRDEEPAGGERQGGKEDLPDIRGFAMTAPPDGGEDEKDDEVAQHKRADALPFGHGTDRKSVV